MEVQSPKWTHSTGVLAMNHSWSVISRSGSIVLPWPQVHHNKMQRAVPCESWWHSPAFFFPAMPRTRHGRSTTRWHSPVGPPQLLAEGSVGLTDNSSVWAYRWRMIATGCASSMLFRCLFLTSCMTHEPARPYCTKIWQISANPVCVVREEA